VQSLRNPVDNDDVSTFLTGAAITFYPEDGGNWIVPNTGTELQNYIRFLPNNH
jgi:hypothetical protein